jgi:hypothetical protein
MFYMWQFLLGYFIGAFAGITIMCLLQVAKEADERTYEKGGK